MPIYTFRDKATGETADRVLSIAERDAFAALGTHEHVIKPTRIIPDIPDYVSPVTGKLVSGRRQRRYDLESNNCREWTPSDSPTGGKIRTERMARKVGGTVAPEYRDHPVNVEYREKHGETA
jgi:hypothetical protein